MNNEKDLTPTNLCTACGFLLDGEQPPIHCPRCGHETAFGQKTMLFSSPMPIALLLGGFCISFISLFLSTTKAWEAILKLVFAIIGVVFSLQGSNLAFRETDAKKRQEGVVITAIAVFLFALVVLVSACIAVTQIAK